MVTRFEHNYGAANVDLGMIQCESVRSNENRLKQSYVKEENVFDGSISR